MLGEILYLRLKFQGYGVSIVDILIQYGGLGKYIRRKHWGLPWIIAEIVPFSKIVNFETIIIAQHD